jgi:hypothetical protein
MRNEKIAVRDCNMNAGTKIMIFRRPYKMVLLLLEHFDWRKSNNKIARNAYDAA